MSNENAETTIAPINFEIDYDEFKEEDFLLKSELKKIAGNGANENSNPAPENSQNAESQTEQKDNDEPKEEDFLLKNELKKIAGNGANENSNPAPENSQNAESQPEQNDNENAKSQTKQKDDEIVESQTKQKDDENAESQTKQNDDENAESQTKQNDDENAESQTGEVHSKPVNNGNHDQSKENILEQIVKFIELAKKFNSDLTYEIPEKIRNNTYERNSDEPNQFIKDATKLFDKMTSNKNK